MTEYQKAQLLYKYMTGDFKYRNSKDHKVSRSAWTKMIDALVNNGLIDEFNASVTVKGQEFCNENHLSINLSVLD